MHARNFLYLNFKVLWEPRALAQLFYTTACVCVHQGGVDCNPFSYHACNGFRMFLVDHVRTCVVADESYTWRLRMQLGFENSLPQVTLRVVQAQNGQSERNQAHPPKPIDLYAGSYC